MNSQIIVTGISRQGTFKEMINLYMEIGENIQNYKILIKTATYKKNQMSILESKECI